MLLDFKQKSTNRNDRRKRSGGFTLIELIIYLALISIFITGAVFFAWDILHGRVKSRVQQEVSQNLRLVSKRINYEIRNANDIVSVGSSNICLDTADRGPLTFYAIDGVLMIGWGNDCGTPTYSYALTSNTISITNLNFEDLTTGDQSSKNIWYSVTIESLGDRQEWQKSQTYTSTIELRSN